MIVPKARRMSSGNWYINLRLGGESINVTAPTEKACIKEAQYIKAEYLADKRNQPKGLDRTLRQVATEHIDSLRSRRSPTTIDGYEKIVRVSYQGIMDLPLSKITYSVMNKAVDEECQRPGKRGKRSPKTIENEYNFIVQVLRENGVNIPRVPLPEVQQKPVQILTADQVYSAVQGTPIELPCLFAMWMTFTISEIRGFTKSKSIRNGMISVVETVVDVKGKVVRKPTAKESTRARTLAIPPYIQYLIDQVDGDVICPLSSQATNKRLQVLLEKAGLPKISFHKLRHIAASTMTAEKIPPAYIKAQGGWSTNYVMERVYTHIYDDARKEADDTMNKKMMQIINNANQKEKKTKKYRLKRSF